MTQQPEFEMTSGRTRTDNDMCIVSCGIGPHYQEGLHSTRLHCEVNVPEAWRLFYRELPLGCPPHEHSMYAFKAYAIQRAIDAGFRFILWMDATFQPIASIKPLWDAIERDGWYCPKQGDHKLGTWSSDAFLRALLLPRFEAMRISLVFSGLVGFDIKNDTGRGLWERWRRSQVEGHWHGAHVNEPGSSLRPFGLEWKGHVSTNADVEGHRHDEAALAAMLYRMGLEPEDRGFLTLESQNGFIDRHVPLVVPNYTCRQIRRCSCR